MAEATPAGTDRAAILLLTLGEESAAAILRHLGAEDVQRLGAAMAGLEDAAERTSFATRHFVALATSAPEWGRALVHADWYLPELRRRVSAFARADGATSPVARGYGSMRRPPARGYGSMRRPPARGYGSMRRPLGRTARRPSGRVTATSQ